MKRYLVVTAFMFLALLAMPASAAPVWGDVFQLRQPDGSLVSVRIWGDEYYQVVESLDGYTLVRDPQTGVICYAALSNDARSLVSTGVVIDSPGKAALRLKPHLRISPDAARAEAFAARARALARMPKAKAGSSSGPPDQGNVQGICLLVEFPDELHTIPPADVDALCNQPGYTANGNNGSVRDYYYDVSNGALTYTNFVPGAYYMALHDKAYYDNPAEDNGPKAIELITEALNALDAQGFDFSAYDSNGDGIVDGVNCFYVGNTQSGWARGLWPHSGFMAAQFDGVTILNYQITYMGNTLYIGTFCHENGHMICWWPDLYDYDYDSAGVGRWCIMASGSYSKNPVEPCAYLKGLAGWTTTNVLGVLPQAGLVAEAGSNVVYKYPNPSSTNEYYLVENRQKSGRDANIPASGLALWHVDTLGNNSFNEMTPDHHFQASLVQADGRFDLEHDANSGDATDVWSAPTYVVCGPSTDPNTQWWSGAPSYLRVSNISAAGTSMTFDYRGAGSAAVDSDGDGMSDWDETRDLDPLTPGVQNPFDPLDIDVSGDNGQNTPDGTPDGENDYDGDGLSNAEELANGSNPLDPHSGLPALSTLGLAILGIAMGCSMVWARR